MRCHVVQILRLFSCRLLLQRMYVKTDIVYAPPILGFQEIIARSFCYVSSGKGYELEYANGDQAVQTTPSHGSRAYVGSGKSIARGG